MVRSYPDCAIKNIFESFDHIGNRSRKDMVARREASDHIDACRMMRVKSVKLRSLGHEGYDINVDTALFASRHCIRAMFLVVCSRGRESISAGAAQKLGLQGEK